MKLQSTVIQTILKECGNLQIFRTRAWNVVMHFPL